MKFLTFILLAAGEAAAPNPVHWSAVAASSKSSQIKVHAQIDSGWHMYAMNEPEGGPVPLEITAADNTGLEVKSIRPSKSVLVFDPTFARRVNLYVGSADFWVTLPKSPPDAVVRARALQVRYQCCNDSMCLAPKNLDIPVLVR